MAGAGLVLWANKCTCKRFQPYSSMRKDLTTRNIGYFSRLCGIRSPNIDFWHPRTFVAEFTRKFWRNYQVDSHNLYTNLFTVKFPSKCNHPHQNRMLLGDGTPTNPHESWWQVPHLFWSAMTVLFISWPPDCTWHFSTQCQNFHLKQAWYTSVNYPIARN